MGRPDESQSPRKVFSEDGPQSSRTANACLTVWTTLITNTDYLSGLLTLDYSLKKHGSKYPLVALYTDTFPEEGHAALAARGIPKQRTEYLLPKEGKDYSADPRFYDCWSKLTPFSLIAKRESTRPQSSFAVSTMTASSSTSPDLTSASQVPRERH